MTICRSQELSQISGNRLVCQQHFRASLKIIINTSWFTYIQINGIRLRKILGFIMLKWGTAGPLLPSLIKGGV